MLKLAHNEKKNKWSARCTVCSLHGLRFEVTAYSSEFFHSHFAIRSSASVLPETQFNIIRSVLKQSQGKSFGMLGFSRLNVKFKFESNIAWSGVCNNRKVCSSLIISSRAYDPYNALVSFSYVPNDYLWL